MSIFLRNRNEKNVSGRTLERIASYLEYQFEHCRDKVKECNFIKDIRICIKVSLPCPKFALRVQINSNESHLIHTNFLENNPLKL